MFTYYNHYGSVTRNANVVCPRDARAIEVLRGETHFSVLGSKARAGELTGGTPVRCFVMQNFDPKKRNIASKMVKTLQ